MKKIIYIASLLLLVNFLSGCGSAPIKITKYDYSPEFYSHHPKSILVLPAVNTTTAADAADQFRYTITKPLTEQGYYVLPVHLVDSFFKQENLPEAELIRNISIKKLKNIFGVDSILYVDIINWDTMYAIIESTVDVGINFSLIDTKSEKEIWQGNIIARSGNKAGTGSIAELIAGMIDAAINTTVDYTELSSKVNKTAFRNFPFGPYHKEYRQDSESKVAVLGGRGRGPSGVEPFVKDGQLIVWTGFISDGTNYAGPFQPKSQPKGSIKPWRTPLNGAAYHILDEGYFLHSHFEDYYYYKTIKGVKTLRHRFFQYENNKPFLFSNGTKVFVSTNSDNKFEYTLVKKEGFLDDPYFTFNIDKVVNLSSKQ